MPIEAAQSPTPITLNRSLIFYYDIVVYDIVNHRSSEKLDHSLEDIWGGSRSVTSITLFEL
jgi:hypothetical protein